ncbi:type VII secretion target [Actinoplanes flavus]|uniref:Excreted virulence factor EspC, type VII ESX diderm n=1 Tax=Actinoplanes flavus TaxID=2820290 RepID=A0ABS3UV16_9ACTN|nr:type VII secretion target [Actinoplanes flavus]MBO3742445.1 hypothetical protein [Actinoplanes flavus]
MQPDLLRVDVAALRTMGTDVTGAAATLRATVEAAGPGLAPAAQPGSAAGTATQAAEKAWVTDLNRLTAQVDQLGRRMTKAADSYRAADQAGADDLRRGGSRVL